MFLLGLPGICRLVCGNVTLAPRWHQPFSPPRFLQSCYNCIVRSPANLSLQSTKPFHVVSQVELREISGALDRRLAVGPLRILQPPSRASPRTGPSHGHGHAQEQVAVLQVGRLEVPLGRGEVRSTSVCARGRQPGGAPRPSDPWVTPHPGKSMLSTAAHVAYLFPLQPVICDALQDPAHTSRATLNMPPGHPGPFLRRN